MQCLAGKKKHYVGGADGITYEMICALPAIYKRAMLTAINKAYAEIMESDQNYTNSETEQKALR